MSDVRFELNRDELATLLIHPQTVANVTAYTNRVVDAANATLEPGEDDVGYQSSVSVGKRARGRVFTAGIYARRSNAIHNTLVRLLSGAF